MMPARGSLLLLVAGAAAFGGLNQLTQQDVYNVRNQERQWQQGSIRTETTRPEDYTNGHFHAEYPEEYVINGYNAENNNLDPVLTGTGGVPVGRDQLGRSLSATNADAESALLEAAKAAQSTPELADSAAPVEIGTAALMTEV